MWGFVIWFAVGLLIKRAGAQEVEEEQEEEEKKGWDREGRK